ncbi:MAG: hypothetical protein FJ088_01130 [Deltaproteobacteria bacterium]|nr:hypothetical protein [Deltaproteobacteria bacterium]
MRVIGFAAAVALASFLFSCEKGAVQCPAHESPAISDIYPDLFLNGTEFTISGSGFLTQQEGTLSLIFKGRKGESDVLFGVEPSVESGERIKFTANSQFLDFIGPDGIPFKGELRVAERNLCGNTSGAALTVELTGEKNLIPHVSGLKPVVIYPSEPISIEGDNFLMKGEGTVVINLEGEFVETATSAVKVINNLQIPAVHGDRTKIEFLATPDIFGISEGQFTGSVFVVNITDFSQEQGDYFENGAMALKKPFLSSSLPAEVSRGGILTLGGKGFMDFEPSLHTMTLFAFTGEFMTEEGLETFSSEKPFYLIPEAIVPNSAASVLLRVDFDPDGKRHGLAAVPGEFKGFLSPQIFFGATAVSGAGIPFNLKIGRDRQIVYLDFLPGFYDGLSRFGLENFSQQVKNRITEVTADDYKGINIEFRLNKPGDFFEYTTVEIHGKDPNDAELLGLDNTTGKDAGNIRFDDIVGGYNAESAASGYYPYGGVFLESFITFSPAVGNGKNPLESPRFDDIFSPFAPELGGSPAVEPSEEAVFAVFVLGNLLADTISHEVGHTLGLTAEEGEFHNKGDHPGWIMDSGVFRPFDERAQIDGAPARVFAPVDRAYLEIILPL